MFEHHSHFQQVYHGNDNESTRIFTLDRSPHYHLISKAIQHRRLRQQEQRKSYTDASSCLTTSYLPRSKKTATPIDTSTTTCTAVENGLPSPPVDGHFKLTRTSSPSPSPSFTSTLSTEPLPQTTIVKEEHDTLVDETDKNGLTKADICVKLQELRDEKHRLFQLIKQQLVLQEEQERRASQEYYIQQQQQQQQQYYQQALY